MLDGEKRSHLRIVDVILDNLLLVEPAAVSVMEAPGQVPVIQCLCSQSISVRPPSIHTIKDECLIPFFTSSSLNLP